MELFNILESSLIRMLNPVLRFKVQSRVPGPPRDPKKGQKNFNFKSFLFNPHVKNRVQCTKYRNIVLSRYSKYFHIWFVIKNISYQILIFYLSCISDIFLDSKSSLSHF